MLKWFRRSKKLRTQALRLKHRSQGFTMLEVLVAILTITTFLAGTLQLIAVDALFKVKAEREAQANFWIQEDLEEVKSIAGELHNDSFCTSGYAQGLETELDTRDTAGSLPGSAPRKLVSKEFEMDRDYSAIAGSPHRLGITYEVTLVGGQSAANDYQNQETTIATSYAEVIPDASFNCK